MRDFARAHEDDTVGGKGRAGKRSAEQDAVAGGEVIDGDRLRLAEILGAGGDLADGGVGVKGHFEDLALVGLDLQSREGGLNGAEDAGLLREGAQADQQEQEKTRDKKHQHTFT